MKDKSSQARGQGELAPRQNLLYTFRTTHPPLHQGFRPPEGPRNNKGCKLQLSSSSLGVVIGHRGSITEKTVMAALVGRWFHHPLTTLPCALVLLALLQSNFVSTPPCTHGPFLSAGGGLSLSDRHAAHNLLPLAWHPKTRIGHFCRVDPSHAPGVLGGRVFWTCPPHSPTL